MSRDFAPGDRVVCISTDSPCCETYTEYQPHYHPVVGRLYIVGEIGMGACSMCDTALPAFCPTTSNLPPNKCWPQACFRKIEPASQSFTAQMRALRPTKEPEHA